MKRYLLLSSLIFSVLTVKAQNEYLQNNPEWTVMRINGVSYPCIAYDSTHYYLNGDSTINSLTYKQLWKNGHVSCSWQSPQPNTSCNCYYSYFDTVPTGFMRSQGLQMYYIPAGDTTEWLLYDFNLNVGDTLPITYTYCCIGGGETVTSIDSIYTPYGYRKRFFINNGNEHLTEGIGSWYGLLEPWGPQLDQAYQLVCYGLNDTAWFPNQGPYCDVITTAHSLAEMEISLQLGPNPATDYVALMANGLTVESIVIYDVFGRAVKQESGVSKIFVGDLPPGVYTCVVTAEKTRINKLLIVE